MDHKYKSPYNLSFRLKNYLIDIFIKKAQKNDLFEIVEIDFKSKNDITKKCDKILNHFLTNNLKYKIISTLPGIAIFNDTPLFQIGSTYFNSDINKILIFPQELSAKLKIKKQPGGLPIKVDFREDPENLRNVIFTYLLEIGIELDKTPKNKIFQLIRKY